MTGSPGLNAYPPIGTQVVVRLRGRITAIGPRDSVKGVRIALDAEGRQSTVIAAEGCAEIEQVAPLEWPPQPGDIWADGGGVEYFLYCDAADSLARLLARTPGGEFLDWSSGRTVPDYLLGRPGPLMLRYRRSPIEASS